MIVGSSPKHFSKIGELIPGIMRSIEEYKCAVGSIVMFIFYILSLISLTLALKKVDVSVVYAVWSGLGTTLIALIGIFYFREPSTTIKILSIGLIIIGVIGLNLSGGGH